MAALYRYYFANPQGREIVLYAPSEDEARKQFKEMYDKEAGELIRRLPW